MATAHMTMRVHDDAQAVSTRTNAELAALMLDQDGRIRDCNETAEELFGFDHDELVTRPVAFLLPQLRDVEWFENGSLNPRLSFLSQIGRQFNAVRRDGSLFASMLFFHDLENGKSRNLRLIIRRAERMA